MRKTAQAMSVFAVIIMVTTRTRPNRNYRSSVASQKLLSEVSEHRCGDLRVALEPFDRCVRLWRQFGPAYLESSIWQCLHWFFPLSFELKY